MKKTFIIILIIFCTTMIVTAVHYSTGVTNPLAGSTWKFKMVVSEDPSTAHYLSTLYGKTTYRFFNDHTYTGTFFELPISGTWEISDDTLVLNNGTNKEEVYTFTLSSNNNLILKGTEKGNRVILEFVGQ